MAATFVADASAALPQAVFDNMPEAKTTVEQPSIQSLFVLDKPSENGGLFVAAHSSHASHASHASSRF